MKAPFFWQTNGLLPALLSPISALWTLGGRMRRAMVTPYSPSIPVLCVGNAVAGGAGEDARRDGLRHSPPSNGPKPGRSVAWLWRHRTRPACGRC